MTKKRRGFDIDLATDLDLDDITETESIQAEIAPVPPNPQRRGPMAAAIHETAGSLRDRAALEAQIRAENDALAHDHVRLKKLGLITDLIDLDLIDTWKLTRDRSKAFDEEIGSLIASIRDVGLSNPIRVEVADDGRYELVQGYRRLMAYRTLLKDTGDVERFGKIPATIMLQGEGLDQLYRQMIDENMVRKDISFAEMAQLAVNYASDPGTFETNPDKVVSDLYGSASYAKRAHIRRFIVLIEALGESLKFAHEIPRNLGLALAERLNLEPILARPIRAELTELGDNRSILDELDVLRRYTRDVDIDPSPRDPSEVELPRVPYPVKGRSFAAPVIAEGTKISFQLRGPQGPAQFTVTNNRIELRQSRDFALIDRARLERALQALLDHLG
jgi:ParB family transcriptional regulator, chromosome partitioning protein